jgi:hypothetical protein
MGYEDCTAEVKYSVPLRKRSSWANDLAGQTICINTLGSIYLVAMPLYM